MERLIKLRRNKEIWNSVSGKVRQVGGGVASSVEDSLTSNFIPNLIDAGTIEPAGCNKDLHRNLQESLDVLHDCLVFSKPGMEEVLPAVRQAYLALCQALLRSEAEESGRVRTSLARALEMLSNLPRPLHTHLHKVQDAVSSVRKCIHLLRSRATNVHSGKERLLLLADQACVGLRLLLAAIKELEMPMLSASQARAGVNYVLSRLVWCLEEATSDVEDREDITEQCGQFVRRMDDAMNLLEGEERPRDLQGLQEMCEDLLGHAMSVAHVALGNDADGISHVCQKVLRRVQEVKKGGEEGTAMEELRLGSLADALLLLEQTVNSALLKLVLEVFSDVAGPLDRLLLAEGEEDVAAKVSAFDLHVDRIMQAGMFAVACSSDAPRVAGVRSCLASLESLEPELVPTILARKPTKDANQPTNPAANGLIAFYSNHWRTEARRLESLLDQLVDPPAFCQVTGEQLARCQSHISSLTDETPLAACPHVEEMIRDATKLHALLSSLSSQGENLGCDTQALSDLSFYLAELKAAVKQPINPKWLQRVSQRARLLTKSVRVLAEQLQESVSRGDDVFPVQHTNTVNKPGDEQVEGNGGISEQGDEKTSVSEHDQEKQQFPESVRDLPLDVTTTPQRTAPPTQMFDLTPFLARGKQLCDARSVLYRTPVATPASTRLAPVSMRLTAAPMLEMQELSEDRAARQLFSDEIPQAGPKEDSLQLNVTDILEGLTDLSATLNSEPSDLVLAPVVRGSKIGASLRSRRALHHVTLGPPSHLTSHTATLTGSPSLGSQVVSVSEREKDLLFLQDKIERLKQEKE